MLPSVAVRFAGQLGHFIARHARSCARMFECIVNSSSPFITITTILTINISNINIILVIIIIINIVVIIDVFGTRCQGSWPMMPANGSDQLWRPVRLASGVKSAGQWCWPRVVPNAAVQCAGQLGKSIARRAHSCTHMIECTVSSSSPSSSSSSSSSSSQSSSSASSSSSSSSPTCLGHVARGPGQ